MRRRAFLAAVLPPCICRAAPDTSREEQRAFTGINRARAMEKVPALVWNEPLARQARLHSARMRDLHFFAHQDPERGEVAKRLTAAGIRWTACAENIFEEDGYPDPAQMALESWLKSPGHRRNLLDPRYTLSGMGVAKASDGKCFFTQIFTRP